MSLTKIDEGGELPRRSSKGEVCARVEGLPGGSLLESVPLALAAVRSHSNGVAAGILVPITPRALPLEHPSGIRP